MDMVGKAMFSQQVSKLKEDFGFKDEEEKEESNYDPVKAAEEEAKDAELRAKRKEEHGKRQAERAANRNKIREKYGLKENKRDQNLINQQEKTSLSSQNSSGSLPKRSPSEEKKDEKCSVM
ncbi:uncharacterized protein [Diadema antillarum]|uniref:uncharacterized protein n=1 Tax=Diadema antillarum TaxID=105358 RepID=UPI003A85C0ED